MKKLIVLAAIFGQTIAQAAEEKKLAVVCLPWNELQTVIQKYDEKPLITAKTVRTIEGKDREVPIVFFINEKTKTFTVVEKVGEDTYCIPLAGSQMDAGEDKPKSTSSRESIRAL